MLIQVILSLLRSQNAIMSSALYSFCTGKVVLMNRRCVVGMQSIIFCKDSRFAIGSPPVNTKSQYGVISSMTLMLSQIFSSEKPVISPYSSLLMQNGQ